MKEYEVKWIDPDGLLEDTLQRCQLPEPSTVLDLKIAIGKNGIYNKDQMELTYKADAYDDGNIQNYNNMNFTFY